MASFNSDQYANIVNSPAITRLKPIERTGKVRLAYASYTTPASAGPAAGDTLNLFKLPVGARVISLDVIAPASFVTSSAAIGNTASATTYGSAVDLSTAGRKQFITTTAALDATATANNNSEDIVYMTFTTGNPAASKQIDVICLYVID